MDSGSRSISADGLVIVQNGLHRWRSHATDQAMDKWSADCRNQSQALLSTCWNPAICAVRNQSQWARGLCPLDFTV